MAVLLILPEPSDLALALLFWKCAPLKNGDVAEVLDKMYALSTLDHKLVFPSLLYYTSFLVLTKCILAVSSERSL